MATELDIAMLTNIEELMLEQEEHDHQGQRIFLFTTNGVWEI